MSDDERYPHETEVRSKLMEWAAWLSGEGFPIAGGCPLAWDEGAAVRRDQARDDFRIPVIVADAELSNRVICTMREQSPTQWLSLSHYHFTSTVHRTIARLAGVHHIRVDDILRHAHENFITFRGLLRVKNARRPAPALALQPIVGR